MVFRKANIKLIILILICAAVLFNGLIFLFAVKSGLVRIVVGEEKKKPTVEDIYRIHDEIQEQKFTIVEDKKKLVEEEQNVSEIKSQLDVEKEALGQQKTDMEKLFEEQLENLKAERESISLVKEEFEEKRLKQLAKIYEGMKPVAVVKVFESMDINTVADVIVRMKSRSSAKIMGKMRPAMASALSEMLKTGKKR